MERPAREEGTVRRVDIAAEVAASAALAPVVAAAPVWAVEVAASS